MAAATKTSVKQHFETGDQPTQAQFGELIDSYLDFNDTLQAIATAAQGGQTGVVIIDSTTDATTAAIGAMGKILLTVGATASAIQHLNAMTTDTTQTITGDKQFQGRFTVSAAVTIKNSHSPITARIIGTDATAGTVETPQLFLQRQWESGNWANNDRGPRLTFGVEASANSAGYTLAAISTRINTALTSATDVRMAWQTRAGDTLDDQLIIGSSAGGVTVGSAAVSPLGQGTLNAGRVYDDGRQITPNQQAFAWAMFNGTGVISLVNSINCASIVDNGTGDYSIVFSTVASDANYGCQIFVGVSALTGIPSFYQTWIKTASAGGVQLGVAHGIAGTSAVDSDRITVTIWDDNPSQGTRVA